LRFNTARSIVIASSRRHIAGRRRFKQKHYDAVIAGSDEIWNLRNPTFEHLPHLFCAGMDAEIRIAYGPSSNGMTYADFADCEMEKRWLRSIDCLSARDERTISLIRNCTSREATKVVDPTLLIDWSDYEHETSESNYVLVYCYALDTEQLARIERLAEQTDSKILVVGQYHHSRYGSLIPNPFRFLGLLRNAAYVVTDSYHGTILSMRYQKPFCSLARGRYKVREILGSYDLLSRDGTSERDLTRILSTKIDYSRIGQQMDENVAASAGFLKCALSLV
jgi:hypothetical protein